MALIKAADLTNPQPSDSVSQDRLDLLRRKLRQFALNPPTDNVQITYEVEETDTGFDVTVDWDATFVLGSEVSIELQDKTFTTLHSHTSTTEDSSHTFNDVDTTTSFIKAQIHNSGGYRVSARVVIAITVDNPVKHPSAPSYVEAGSNYDQSLVDIEITKREEQDWKRQADVVEDIFDAKHDEMKDVERHIDLIFGAISNYGENPLTKTVLNNSAKLATSTRLFPLSWSEIHPVEKTWVKPASFEETTAAVIQFYDSPWGGSTRTAGDQSEWQDLQDAIDGGTFPIDIFNETDGTLVTYDTETEAQNRQSEIETIVSDFNSSSTMDNLVNTRWDYINNYTNRVIGFRFRQNASTQGLDPLNARIDQSDLIESEIGLT